jgi:hypothetical protein
MKLGKVRYLWLISILLIAVFACQAVSGVQERVDTVKSTAMSVATDVQQGRDLIGTARAITTQVGGSGLIQTAQALATQADESGLLSTAQAFATEQGPGLVETALAVATQEGPAILATAQAYITQASPGTAPEDIPIIDGQKEMFYQSAELVSYIISVPYAQVVEFYKNQMPANGWTKVDQDWVETGLISNLQFEKNDRRASIVLTTSSGGNGATVLITISAK